MPVIVVTNPKGGVGKTTLSTHVAAYFANQGHAVMLGDVDRQQSSKMWLTLRAESAAPIASWAVDRDHIAKPPKGTTHVVLDTPGGLRGKRLLDVLKRGQKLLVPLQASVFDMTATLHFLAELADCRVQTGKLQVALVGLRVDERTRSAEQLRQFVARTELPLLTMLRNTQNYPLLAARGLTVFDLPTQQAQRDLSQWAPICRWLDAA
ncbi:MAG: ParA family protein [Rhodoferax sp.]|jgi:chromosome partitioning protein|uniref:ParA family protein n=1 Tax=Rhodoferax sp. TaxID=50421 RepID=UPI001B509F80|nr:ParA family protein [Rhodoferax sp.]MBP9149345.1 ParA family protein [Rhodoferax sp.]MBP9736794.1 ParA family protein [Rhodoferax sp.]